MPESPDVGLLTRFVLENPWPLVIAAAALALGTGWHALRVGPATNLRWSAAAALLAVGVFAASSLVVTAGEHGRRVVRSLVDAAEQGDAVAARAVLADDVTMSFGDVRRPGIDHAATLNLVDQLAGRYRIESNRVTQLDAFTTGPEAATVHLSCSTELSSDSGFGPTPSRWVIEVERDADGTWHITRLVLISVAGRKADSGVMRW